MFKKKEKIKGTLLGSLKALVFKTSSLCMTLVKTKAFNKMWLLFI